MFNKNKKPLFNESTSVTDIDLNSTAKNIVITKAKIEESTKDTILVPSEKAFYERMIREKPKNDKLDESDHDIKYKETLKSIYYSWLIDYHKDYTKRVLNFNLKENKGSKVVEILDDNKQVVYKVKKNNSNK